MSDRNVRKALSSTVMECVSCRESRETASIRIVCRDETGEVRMGLGYNWIGMIRRAFGMKEESLDWSSCAGRSVRVRFNVNRVADRLEKAETA